MRPQQRSTRPTTHTMAYHTTAQHHSTGHRHAAAHQHRAAALVHSLRAARKDKQQQTAVVRALLATAASVDARAAVTLVDVAEAHASLRGSTHTSPRHIAARILAADPRAALDYLAHVATVPATSVNTNIVDDGDSTCSVSRLRTAFTSAMRVTPYIRHHHHHHHNQLLREACDVVATAQQDAVLAAVDAALLRPGNVSDELAVDAAIGTTTINSSNDNGGDVDDILTTLSAAATTPFPILDVEYRDNNELKDNIIAQRNTRLEMAHFNTVIAASYRTTPNIQTTLVAPGAVRNASHTSHTSHTSSNRSSVAAVAASDAATGSTHGATALDAVYGANAGTSRDTIETAGAFSFTQTQPARDEDAFGTRDDVSEAVRASVEPDSVIVVPALGFCACRRHVFTPLCGHVVAAAILDATVSS